MKSLVTSALLITAFSAAITFGQAPASQPQEPVRMNISPGASVQFRIVDPVAKQTQDVQSQVANGQGERQLNVPRPVQWSQPIAPAAIPRPIAEPRMIAAPSQLRPAPQFQAAPQTQVPRSATIRTADAHVGRQRKLVPQIRLVQADSNDFLDDLKSPGGGGSDDIDELLEQAQKLIETEREKATSDRSSPEDLRSRMQEEIDRLLPDDDDSKGSGDLLDDDDSTESEEDFSDLVDPEPKPIRTQKRQIPATMGDIFSDENEKDPYCEQMFCQRMWACAGGKCMSPMDRMKRNFRRNYALFYSPCGTEVCRPMENFKCPPRNNQMMQQPTQMVGPAPMTEEFSVSDGGLIGDMPYAPNEFTVDGLPITHSPLDEVGVPMPAADPLPNIMPEAADTINLAP